VEISSSQIREKVKKRQSIKYLVPPRVEEYIKKKKLYTR
jgi:nicotinic acid mononucleotide adenylyltransferase